MTSNHSITLSKLIATLEECGVIVDKTFNLNTVIRGITLDSRTATKGDLFLAYPGHVSDGREYIAAAIKKGITVVFYEANNSHEYSKLLSDNQQVILVPVPYLAKYISHIAATFYGEPSKKMTVIGITGTNGKTSICYLTTQVLQFLNQQSLMLSTLGNGDLSELKKTENTTPDAITIQKMSAEYLNKKYKCLVMEVSSHGIEQSRVSALDFNIAVFTNLSHDHLEYHGDMETYFLVKRQLLLMPSVSIAIINADDEYGRRLLKDPEISCKKIAYSCVGKNSEIAATDWVVAEDIELNSDGISAGLHTPWGSARVKSNLLGDFNLSNLLAVAGIMGYLFGQTDKWIIGLNAAQPVVGRMQQFKASNKATVVVDYAHTPDALEKALETLRNHCEGSLWCVFGCGGDRDTSKRSMMGRIAEEKSDATIITDDNPRTEDANIIVKMIKEGMKEKNIKYISDRKQAIEYALGIAASTDMILVAGKGHEDYQEIGTAKRAYSDLETVGALMELRA